MSKDGAESADKTYRGGQPLPPPDYPCPYCGDTLWDEDTEWLTGLDDATEVPGEGDHRAVHHCPICETAVVRRA